MTWKLGTFACIRFTFGTISRRCFIKPDPGQTTLKGGSSCGATGFAKRTLVSVPAVTHECNHLSGRVDYPIDPQPAQEESLGADAGKLLKHPSEPQIS